MAADARIAEGFLIVDQRFVLESCLIEADVVPNHLQFAGRIGEGRHELLTVGVVDHDLLGRRPAGAVGARHINACLGTTELVGDEISWRHLRNG